jgi:hypothetical protein
MTQMSIDALKGNPSACISHAATHLKHGELAVVLGAGVSVPLGLPDWIQLVERCCLEAGVDFDRSATGDKSYVQAVTEKVQTKTKGEFRKLLSNALYQSADLSALYLNPLLISIGALIMGSTRGSVRELMTFNFDDRLERYLDLYGFTWESITRLPTLRGSCDVSIYHPHGFLPSDPSVNAVVGDEIIFSQISFDQRLGDRSNAWSALMEDLLLRKVCLFVGVSIDSPTLNACVARVALGLTNRISGYWLLGPNDHANSEDFISNRNIVPIRLSTYAEYSSFIMEICQAAAKR